MTWSDSFVMALRSIRRRFGRSVLTVAAVALAAALLVSLLIAVGAARSRVLDAVSKGGPLTGIEVLPDTPDFGQLDSDTAKIRNPRPIDDIVRRRIAAIPGVRSVVALVSSSVYVVAPPPPSQRRSQRQGGSTRATVPFEPFRGTLSGVDLRRVGALPVTVLAGRLPSPGSRHEIAVTDSYLRAVGVKSTDANAVVGSEVEFGAPRLFTSDGESTVRGRWTRSTVVGVVAAQGATGELIGSLEQAEVARRWTAASDVSGGPADQRFIDDLGSASKYSGLFVVTDGFDSVGPARAAITKIGFSSSAPESLIASVRRYSQVVEIVLTAIGLIALGIAALGIANAMLAAVRERRREIGVLKAIGARDRDVRRVFLVEAGLLGLAGGLIGTAFGYALARVVGLAVNSYLTGQGLAGVHVGLPVSIIAAGIFGSGLLALVAGTVPAQRAAHLPARQAMGDG